MTTNQKPQDEATAPSEYGMAVARVVRRRCFQEWVHDRALNPKDERPQDVDLAAIVASVEPPEQRYPPIANDQDKRLMLETLESALRVPGGPEKMYADLRAELGLPPDVSVAPPEQEMVATPDDDDPLEGDNPLIAVAASLRRQASTHAILRSMDNTRMADWLQYFADQIDVLREMSSWERSTLPVPPSPADAQREGKL